MRCSERRLRGFGLTITSDREVPGALSDQRPRSNPDLHIATLPSLASLELSSPVYRLADDTIVFSAPEVGRYACRHDTIDLEPVRGAKSGMVSALLIATALPACLWLRGGTMLHAAAVVAPSGGPAIAIAGPSGVGKSALTAELLSQGGRLLADDSICLRRQGDRIEATGLPGGYHIGGFEDVREFRAVPPAQSSSAAMIGAMIILARTDGSPALTRLSPSLALEKLLANLHRPAISALLGRQAQTLATIAFIAQNCAVYDWRRPCAALSRTECDMLAREQLW